MKTTLNGLLFLLFFVPSLIFAQNTVSGTVMEQSSSFPLPGVNIIIKGTTTGTATDFDGGYQINVNNGDVLVFSYVGYVTQEITYNGQSTIDIQLAEDAAKLDEVVVIGYGTTTKKDATGSLEAITSEDFTKGNIVSPENLLSGRVAGVTVNTSGAPGSSGSEIRIRGGSSINASNDPLIIIDGLPITNDNVSGSRGILATINPNDIDSFTVLKDASATAIYGSRASNGVIIIVTKKGKSTFSADFDTQYTFGTIEDKIDVFSADEFRALIAERYPDRVDELGDANTNWQDEIFRNTVSATHNLTIRGEIANTLPTRFSFGATRQEGTILTSLFERRNLSLAVNPSFFDDHLKVNLNANMAFEDNRFADSGLIGSALVYDPTQPVYDPTSPFAGFYQHRNGGTLLSGTNNPVFNLLNTWNYGDTNRFFGNLNFDYKFHFLPELNFVLNLGYDETEGVTNNRARYATNDDVKGNFSRGEQLRTNRLLDGFLTYKKEFDDFDTEFTAGYSYQKFTNSGNDTGNQRDPESFPSSFSDPDVVLIGYFGRANLGFKDKYLLTLTYRRDGTSRFSEENRWGDFPAAAIAWNVSDEDFLKNSKVISNLKLRAGWGITGQQDIGSNSALYLERYRSGNENSQYQFGNSPISSVIPLEINPDIKWEETQTIEFGIDYGLFDNKINGSLGVFQKDSKDLLFDAPVSDISNFSNRIIQNIGNLRVRGLEFTTNTDVVRSEDMSLNFNFNATLLDREITELAYGQDVTTGGIGGGTGNFIQIFREGEAPNSFYVFKQLRDSNGNPIEGAYADLNGDNIINDEDRYLKDSPNAEVILGFQTNFEYKNFDLAFNLRANIGNHVYNNVVSSRAQYALIQDQQVLANIPTNVLETNFINTSDVIISDLYVENASYLKMDNVTLGYTFKDVSNLLKSVRIWGGVQNVFTITEYSGLDPEVYNGIDNIIYPRPRNFLVGANLKF